MKVRLDIFVPGVVETLTYAIQHNADEQEVGVRVLELVVGQLWAPRTQ